MRRVTRGGGGGPNTTERATRLMAASKQVEKSKFEQFVEYAQSLAAPVPDDLADQLNEQAIIRIADATTVDEVFAALRIEGLTALKDIPDRTPLVLESVRFVTTGNSEFSGRTGVFAIIDAIDLDTGEPVAIDTGVERVMGALVKWHQMGSYPVEVTVTVKNTLSGNSLVSLAPPRKR